MGYRLSHNPSYHHLVKQSMGGRTEVSNGAVLNNYAHAYLHLIENMDLEIYLYINALLQKENEEGYVSQKNIRAIHSALESFEKEYSGKRSSKGKILIKQEYLKRDKM